MSLQLYVFITIAQLLLAGLGRNNIKKAYFSACLTIPQLKRFIDLFALIENENSKWAAEMLAFLYKIYHLTHKGTEIYTDFEELDASYNEIIQIAEKEEPVKLNPT